MTHKMILHDDERTAVLKCRFDKLVKRCYDAQKRIDQLNAVIFVKDRDFQNKCQEEIRHLKAIIQVSENQLSYVRGDLGIKTPISNKGTL